MTEIRLAFDCRVDVRPGLDGTDVAAFLSLAAGQHSISDVPLTAGEAAALRDAVSTALGEDGAEALRDELDRARRVVARLTIDEVAARSRAEAAEARAVRAEETAADLLARLDEANRARQRAEAELAEARTHTEAALAEARARVRRVADPVAETVRLVREAVRTAYCATEDASAETALYRLGDALDALL